MLGYHPTSPGTAPALVWDVRERARPCRYEARSYLQSDQRSYRRAQRGALARAVVEVEGSAEYRRSLAELHQLASRFQRGLDGAQREVWLALEEALLAHAERLNRTYHRAGFRRGVEWCARSSSPGQHASGPCRGGRSAPGGARAEAAAALAAGADLVTSLARLALAFL
ncbi:MAG TPA: hypothetical protein VNN80_13745, partial [Polyangiaceae bacterium]|nr:hypothetical protein [Polyangiaceae bacterium]